MDDLGNLLIVILPIVALILTALSVGGLYFWWVSTREAKNEPENRLAELDQQAKDPTLGEVFSGLKARVQPPAPAAAPAPPQAPVYSAPAAQPIIAPQVDGETVEVMRLLRDLADGSLIVEINGRRYYSLREMTDPQVGRRFLSNAQALAAFARLEKFSGAAPAQPEPISAPPPALPWEQAPSPPPQMPAQRPMPAQQPSPTAAAPAPKGFIARALSGAPPSNEAAPVPTISIADQIEELLQQRLLTEPSLATRSIHIRPSFEGGVTVEVDGRFYDGVGAVTDEQVKAFIQRVIQEWEARQ